MTSNIMISNGNTNTMMVRNGGEGGMNMMIVHNECESEKV
jgi:hypothetical protein